jgi:V/A-type H+-transporting ATPase subunit D
MARYGVPPTKTSLLRLRRDYQFAHEGHELLEQKREILVAELMGVMDRAKELQRHVDEALALAYASLRRAVVRMGRRAVSAAAHAVDTKTAVRIGARRIMGVAVPVVDTEIVERPPHYSLGDTSFWLDESLANFRDVLHVLGKYAETSVAVARLTEEVKKTIRRVNALEKIALPDFRETIKYISDVIEEAEREAFYVLKLIKNRLEARRRAAHA